MDHMEHGKINIVNLTVSQFVSLAIFLSFYYRATSTLQMRQHACLTVVVVGIC